MNHSNLFDQLSTLNPWWQKPYQEQVMIARPLYLQPLLSSSVTVIDVLTGARRVGKTSILKQIIQELIKKSTTAKNILYVTGELPALQNLRIIDIYQTYVKRMHPKQVILFLDEVQELPNWQQQVKFLYDNYHIKMYLTGSSGLVLSKQTAKLTGRFKETHVMPLSFTEYLAFKGIALSAKDSLNRTIVDAYINSGGYPEHVLRGDDMLLMQTVESIMYRDLLTHYGIRNPAILQDLLQLLCDKIGTPVSFNTIAHDLKMDPQTAQFYVQYLQDVYLVYPLYRLGKSHKMVKGFIPKYYLNDTGILRLFSQHPREGHLVENAVFLHFYQLAQRQGKEIFYDVSSSGEVDFVMGNERYEVKTKPLSETLREDVIYIVPEVNPELGYRQIELWRLLSQTS